MLTNPSPDKEVACTKSPGWAYTPARDKAQIHFLSCKRRTCEKCGWYWHWKWRAMLQDKRESDIRLGRPAISRAITLTTACDPGYQAVWKALKWFWQLIRKRYSTLQYWGVVEYNQKHTQPHFHFILSDDTFIPQLFIQECWQTAQRWAGFERIAFNVRIEKIRSNIQAYFTKYLTKLTDGKDEIPRPENWHGRYVRYSRKFFSFPTSVILSSLSLNKSIESGEIYRSYYKIKPKLLLDNPIDFILDCKREEKHWINLLSKTWDFIMDRSKATIFEPAIDKQLTYAI